MTKKAKIYIMVVVWTIVAIQIIVNENLKKDNEIIEAFNISEGSPMESIIDGYGYFGSMELDAATKETMLLNLASKLGITEDYNILQGKGENYTKSQLLKTGKNAKTNIQIISMEAKNNLGKDIVEQYILIDITLYNNLKDAQDIRGKVKKIYEEIGVSPILSIELNGSLKGELSKGERQDMVTRLLNEMKAEVIEEYDDANIYTLYAYSEKEDNYILQNEKKINIHIIMCYDEDTDRTFLKIASPVASGSY